MPALAGTALLSKFKETTADRCRYVSNSDGETYKAAIVELFEGKKKKDGENGARITPSEGPKSGKTFFVPVDRLKGLQGRQPGFSPKKASPEAESPAPAARKPSEVKPAKSVAKPPKNDEAFNLESAREEMKDITEALQDLAERSAALAAFYENIEMDSPAEDEEAETSPEPEPVKPSNKRGTGKKGSAKPRHEDEDETD
jgi:hypothetical protein